MADKRFAIIFGAFCQNYQNNTNCFNSVVLGVERKFFDQLQMEDLPFMNTIEHILCSSRQKHGRKKKAFMGPGKVFVSNQWLILGGEC